MKYNFFLLRGWIRDSRHWGDFPQYLLEHNPDSELFTLDNPGVGKFKNHVAPTTIEETVDFLRNEFYRVAPPHGENILVAVSMGGMNGISWFHQYPGDFKKLILINSSFSNLNPFYQRLLPKNYFRILKIALGNDLESREKNIFQMTCNNDKKILSHLERWIWFAKDNPVSRTTAFRQLVAASKFKAPIKELKNIVVLTSKNDQLVSCQCSRRVANIYKAPLYIHDWGGHDLTFDDPDWVGQKIAKVLSA